MDDVRYTFTVGGAEVLRSITLVKVGWSKNTLTNDGPAFKMLFLSSGMY